VSTLLETLAAELERPREISAQVANHLVGTYGLTRDAIGSFLVNGLPKLEDYEIDLILSPLFTPALPEQAVFAEFLGRDSIAKEQWPGLVQQLVALPARAELVTEDGQTHLVILREVTIERFMHRLRLDGLIPEPLFKLISDLPPAADRPVLKAIARRLVWKTEARQNILGHFLRFAIRDRVYQLDDVAELLKLTETYEPADASELLARIPHWQQVLRQEINAGAGAKPFFNERVEELHGGGRDQRRPENSRLAAKEKEQAFLERLQSILTSD